MTRRVVPALFVLLGLFHVWLFGSQLWEGRLAEPGVIVRWVFAAGLLAALVRLHRRGASAFWGRRAVSIWLLAALLHGPAMVDDSRESPALPEAITAVVQIAAASVALGVGLALIAAFAHRRRHRERPAVRRVVLRHARLLEGGRAARFAPRPPPSRPALASR